MYDYSPGEGLALTRENRRVVVEVAKDLVESKTKGRKSDRHSLALLGAFVPQFRTEVSSNL